MPGTYSVMDMGYVDDGGGPVGVAAHDSHDGHHGTGGVSVADLVADPDRKADVTVDLTAEAATVELASGRQVEGYTVNGTSPGPVIEARQGQLLEVHLRNESVDAGITLHWHGGDVPNAEDEIGR